MTTIYIRAADLGLDYTDHNLLSRAGDLVSQKFVSNNLHGRVLFTQQEHSGEYKVWAYPDEYIPEIDAVLKQLTKPKRKRIEAKKAFNGKTS